MFTYEVSGEVSDSYHFSGVYTISSMYTYILLCIYAIYIFTHIHIYNIWMSRIPLVRNLGFNV